MRQPSDPNATQLPFRLSTHLVGLEIVVMNNGAKIEAIEELLGIRTNLARSKRSSAMYKAASKAKALSTAKPITKRPAAA